MDSINNDPRFAKITQDKKFRSIPKKHKKIKIDSRFQSLFTNEKFVSKCTVDKRGRPKKLSAKDNYEKFYELDSSDSDDNEDSENEVSDDNNDNEESSDISKGKVNLPSTNIDYARGKGVLCSESSSEEDSDETEDEENNEAEEDEAEVFDKWGELDGDAERTEDATDRLAVCNMDWDRVGADDIFLVLSSFCPSNGNVKSVNIYLSDFGKERLEEEKTLGPRELRQLKGEESDEDEEGILDKKKVMKKEAAAMDRVRQYQVARLKYYYAVVHFDSVDTANHVYSECDGMEYEMSATRLDLRFIPFEMTFTTPTSSCLSPPHPEKYQPKTFFTTALQQSKVELTWDEEDSSRSKAMKDVFSKVSAGEDLDNIEGMNHLIASASEDEDESDAENVDLDTKDDIDTIGKYKALLADISEKK